MSIWLTLCVGTDFSALAYQDKDAHKADTQKQQKYSLEKQTQRTTATEKVTLKSILRKSIDEQHTMSKYKGTHTRKGYRGTTFVLCFSF